MFYHNLLILFLKCLRKYEFKHFINLAANANPMKWVKWQWIRDFISIVGLVTLYGDIVLDQQWHKAINETNVISKVQWYSSEGNFTSDTSAANNWNWLWVSQYISRSRRSWMLSLSPKKWYAIINEHKDMEESMFAFRISTITLVRFHTIYFTRILKDLFFYSDVKNKNH